MDKGKMGNNKEMDLPKANKNSHYLVAALIVVIVLLVVTIAVGGGMFAFRYNSMVNTQKIVPNYQDSKDVKKNGEVENVQIDRQRRIEKLTHNYPNGSLDSIVVIDYYSRLVSMYVKEDDTCYLVGGLIREMDSFERSLQIINNKNETLDTDSVVYKSENEPMLNHDLLTEDLLPYCKDGKGVYWLLQTYSNAPKRQKRRTCVKTIKSFVWGLYKKTKEICVDK